MHTAVLVLNLITSLLIYLYNYYSLTGGSASGFYTVENDVRLIALYH